MEKKDFVFIGTTMDEARQTFRHMLEVHTGIIESIEKTDICMIVLPRHRLYFMSQSFFYTVFGQYCTGCIKIAHVSKLENGIQKYLESRQP